MALVQARGTTVGSTTYNPDTFFQRWAAGEIFAPHDAVNVSFQTAIRLAFGLPTNDNYVYHATASVNLAQVQLAIDHGANNGLHAWYRDEHGKPVDAPLQADIDAYTAIFASTTSTTKALTSFDKNAKKGSLRASVASHLIEKRLVSVPIAVPKLKKAHINPYLDFWSWSCKSLEWCGPDQSTSSVRHSHHVLPVFYHHFGCVCPSFESIVFIQQLSGNKPVIDAGSGNGYWTYLLRRQGLTVNAVDNGDSVWRTMWIDDTIKQDAAQYLQKHDGGANAVLLLVYPQVSTNFTKNVLASYRGSTICVAGTQNLNGFTAFKHSTIDQHVHSTMPEYEKIIQTPLPSFAGKDEAFFVFQRS